MGNAQSKLVPPSTAARDSVFSIPELIENILNHCDNHGDRFAFGYVNPTIRDCRDRQLLKEFPFNHTRAKKRRNLLQRMQRRSDSSAIAELKLEFDQWYGFRCFGGREQSDVDFLPRRLGRTDQYHFLIPTHAFEWREASWSSNLESQLLDSLHLESQYLEHQLLHYALFHQYPEPKKEKKPKKKYDRPSQRPLQGPPPPRPDRMHHGSASKRR